MKLRSHRKQTQNHSDLLWETAYHEAGHVCFAYFSKFQVEEVLVDINEPGNGETAPIYLNHHNTVAVLFDVSDDPSCFDNLDVSEKKSIKSVMMRLTHILLAGPIAEGRFKGLRDNIDAAEVIVENSDSEMCAEIFNGLNLILLNHNIPQVPHNFLEEEVLRINEVMTLDEFWIPISEVAKAILNKKSASLNQVEIEAILDRTGFLNYVEEWWKK